MRKTVLQLLSALLISFIVMLLNFPIAFALVHSSQNMKIEYAMVLTMIPVIYSLTIYIRMHIENQGEVRLFYPIAYGTIMGYLICIVSVILCSYAPFFNFMSKNGGFKYYNIGLIIPMLLIVYFHLKNMWQETFSYITLVFIIFYCSTTLFYIYQDIVLFKSATSVTVIFITILLGIIVSSTLLLFVYRVIRTKVRAFLRVGYFLSTMGKPVGAFFIGYIAILLFFTGIFSLLDFFQPNSFHNPGQKSFFDYFLYSYFVLTDWNASQMKPLSHIGFGLSMLENFLGIVWITVVFAATLGYLQKPFLDLSKQLRELEKHEENKKE